MATFLLDDIHPVAHELIARTERRIILVCDVWAVCSADFRGFVYEESPFLVQVASGTLLQFGERRRCFDYVRRTVFPGAAPYLLTRPRLKRYHGRLGFSKATTHN